jgi:hypothetical protein
MSGNSHAASVAQRPSGRASSSVPKGHGGSDVPYIGGDWRHGIIDEFARAHWITVRHQKGGYPI